jgi:hypothetical protein
MKTLRWTDNRMWIFRHPGNGYISVTLPENSVPLDADGFALWEDIVRLLSA